MNEKSQRATETEEQKRKGCVKGEREREGTEEKLWERRKRDGTEESLREMREREIQSRDRGTEDI